MKHDRSSRNDGMKRALRWNSWTWENKEFEIDIAILRIVKVLDS